MKILIINSVCGIRSTGRIVTDIAKKYIANGHECRIAYGREFAPQKYQSISYKISSHSSVILNALKARVLDNEGFNAKIATKKFIKWANNYNPDVVWLHNLHGYYINIELLFDWIKSRPQMEIRWTLHDCWAFTGHCAHFSFVKCDLWKTGCHGCPQKNVYPKSFFLDNSKISYERKRKAFSGVKNLTLITPSKWLAELTRQSFLHEYPVEVHYNTIDNSVFCPTPSDFREKMGLQDSKIVLGVASAWSDRKGLGDFVKLADKIGADYTVVLVGLDKAPSDKVMCIPRTNSVKELAEIYTAADIFVNLTYEDTYPTVNLEAQGCGTPCLTYQTGGSVENVPPENVVDQGDLDSIIAKIKGIIG